MTYTKLTRDAAAFLKPGEDLYSCNDCGALGKNTSEIIHYDTCVSGDSEKWEKFYSEED